MSVYIESIQIQKLGPLDSIQFNLGSLNLIYGPNESGKTYLVEFLLQSIFRHAKKWDLRDINVEGSVNIKGLGEQIAEFSPSSSKKIEDYWVQNNSGLPLNMARLLIVKGGELALSSGSPGGVNRDVLKNALTSQALLDTIQEKIQPTIRNAEIIDQKIIGKKQGQLKDHNNLQDDLKDIDSLLEEIELNYSLGPARQINIQINDIKEQIKLQNKAKRHLAFLLSKEYQELLEKRNELSNDKFLSLRDRVRDHNKLKTDRELLTKKINSVQGDIDVYHWLESAQLVWEEKGLETKALPNIMLGASGGILLCAGLALVIMQNIISRPDLFWPGVITATLGALVLVFYVIRLLKWSSVSNESDERESIQDSYKEKFGQSLNGITDLKTQQNKLLEIYIKAKSNQEDLGKLEIQLTVEGLRIKEIFLEILGQSIAEDYWDINLKAIKKQSDQLDADISRLGRQIDKLNLEEELYLDDPQDIDYDSQVEADLELRLTDLAAQATSLQSTLDSHKTKACVWTRDEISTPWSDVLHNLHIKRQNISQSYLNLTAELVAKIGLSNIIKRIEAEEDQKILENINTGEVSSLLKKLTGRYQSLDLVDDQIFVRDPYREYPLRDLSTGAREQVQLALRLGIASHVSGGTPLFVILDDAFQHSDWDRRKTLVKETVDLVKQGWQIIYLSMDNNIRDLFQEMAKPILKRKFNYFEL